MKSTLRPGRTKTIVDFMRSIVCLVHFALLFSPMVIAGQAGAGISGRGGERTSVNYLREHWGPPDSVRLGAVAIFRGAANWGLLRDSAEEARSRKAVDSAFALTAQRGRCSGRTITPRAVAWIEYDSRSRTVYVWDRPFKMPPGDSTLVLLIDNVDRVNGEPRIATMVIPHRAYADELSGKESSNALAAFVKLEDRWDGVLRRYPAIRDYLP